MNGKKFIKNGLLLTSASLVMQMIGLYLSIYFSNIIGAQGMGLFQLIMSVYMLGVTVGIGGISIAVTRISSRELEKRKTYAASLAVWQGIFLSVCTAGLTTIALYFASDFIVSEWINDIRTLYPLKTIVFSLPFVAVSTSVTAFFMSSRKVVLSTVLMVVEQLFRIVVTLYAMNVSVPDTESYLISIALASLASDIFSALIRLAAFMLLVSNGKKENTPLLIFELASISLPIGMSGCIRGFLNMLQNFLVPIGLRKYGSAADVAMASYGVIKGMAIPVVVFPASILSSFIALLIPEISRFYENGNRRAIGRAIMKSTGLTIIFSVALSGIFITYGEEIGYIAYKNEEVGKYIMLLAPLIIFMFLDDVVDCVLKGLNQQMKSLKYNIIESAVRVVMLYFLVPIHGIYGYLVVIFTGNILNFALSFNRLTQIADVYIDFKNWIVKPIIAITISCVFTKSFMLRGIVLYNYTITTIWSIFSTAFIFTIIIILWDCLPKSKENLSINH